MGRQFSIYAMIPLSDFHYVVRLKERFQFSRATAVRVYVDRICNRGRKRFNILDLKLVEVHLRIDLGGCIPNDTTVQSF